MLQGDGRFDYDCMKPRNMATTLMTMIILRLEHVMSMRNSCGNSTFNAVERVISSKNLALQVMTYDRLKSSKKVENKIVKAKSVKNFVDTNSNKPTMIK